MLTLQALVALYLCRLILREGNEPGYEAEPWFTFVLEILTVLFPLQSFGFPGFVPAGKVTPPIQNSAILMSELFTCHG